MHGKVCLVTGATAGIGQATALILAQLGATVVGIGRRPAKNENSTRMIKEATGNQSVEYLLVDLSSAQDIRAVAGQFLAKYGRLDVLVNNAGASFEKRQENGAGIEMTFALNHLGYFLLTNLLTGILQESAPSRVIIVSSGLHKLGQIDFDDIPLKKGYSRSKASAILNLKLEQQCQVAYHLRQEI
jgi:retinol dehydrogenase 12